MGLSLARSVWRVAALSAALALSVPPAHAAGTIVLVTGARSPLSNDAQSGFLDRLAAETFRRIGIQVTTSRLPSERALRIANSGEADGDLHRIAGMTAQYPNLIQVPEPTLDMEFAAFTRTLTIATPGWEALKGHAIGYIRGWKIVERQLRDTPDLVEVYDEDALFAVLEKGRVDAVIYDTWGGLELQRARGIKGIRVLQPSLAVNKMYFYLHRKHEALVPRIAAAIRNVKADGTFDLLYREILAPLAPRS